MFKFISDPGHAWLQVSIGDLRDVGMTPTDFSKYSYRDRNGAFYLEEDCDAGKFLTKWEAKHGRKATFNEVHQEQTFIRNLPSIH